MKNNRVLGGIHMSIRKELGLENLRHFTGELGIDSVEKLKESSPDLADFITEFAFGDIYSLPLLTERDKIIITLTTLVTQGELEALRLHFHSAKHIGLTNEEIKSILLHAIPYIGFPKVIKATQLFEEIILSKAQI